MYYTFVLLAIYFTFAKIILSSIQIDLPIKYCVELAKLMPILDVLVFLFQWDGSIHVIYLLVWVDTL